MDLHTSLHEYIKVLPIPEADPNDAPLREAGTRAEEAGVPPAAPGAVDAGAVLSFVDGVPAAQREDVLNSVQLAQRAATGAFDRCTQVEQWYGKFTEVLQRVGWVTEQFAFVKHEQGAGDLRMDRSALAILAAVASQGALGVLTQSISALEKLAGDSHEISMFERNATVETSGNFQLGAVELGKAGNLSMALGAFYYRANDHRTKVLFATWGARDIEFWTGAQKMTLNAPFYGDARDAVRRKLGDPAAYVAGLDF